MIVIVSITCLKNDESGFFKEAFAFIPFFFKIYIFPFKICNALFYDKVINKFFFDPFKISCSPITFSFHMSELKLMSHCPVI